MSKTIIISEKQVEQLKKVRQGIIAYEENKPDYKIGFEKPVDMSSYAHVIENKVPVVLKEENRTQKRKCVEIISNYSSHYVTPYLNNKLVDIPDWLKPTMAPNSTLFKSVANNQNGCDKLIDFLRLNLYQQFGINRNSSLTFFIPGIARIACKDLGYYSFSPIEMKGGCIIKFARLLKLIDRKEGFMESTGIIFDEDFNNMSYYDMMNVFEPKIKEYIETTFSGLEAEENKPVKVSDYTIYPISDYIDGGMLHPDRDGKKILNHFARYTDWCVCAHENAEFEYAQYLSNGGKMYICAKDGFEKIQRPETTVSPLDEYGLSLINVIVAEDGLPDNITTRYNHDFGGENHSELWEALHLQKVLDVNYKEVFKPRSKEELHAMNINESRIITENQNDKKANDYLKNVVGITDFEKIRKFIMDIYEAIPNSRLMRGRYLLGIVRLIHENGNKFKATKMNNILYNMKKQEVYMDRNLNDMTYDELVEKFYIPEEVQEVDGVKKIRQVANGYTIKHIETFDEMRMSCDGEWCISYADDIWYEIVEECHECVYLVENQEMVNSIDENSEEWYETSEIMSDPEDMSVLGTYGSGKAPYDTYGLSRFIVLIHPSYISVYSRWNIPNCLDGGFLNKQQLEDLLGLPFDEAFPYIKPVEYNEEDMFENRQIVNESAADLEYHYTRLGNLLSMMRNDAIDLHQSNIESNRNGANFLSLTRMRSNTEGYGLTVTDDSSIVIRIELNGQKLNNVRHVNIRPYDYVYNNWEEIMSDASDEERINRQTGREWGAWNAEAEDSLTLKDGGEQILDAIDLINRIDILLKPNIQNNHLENIKLWREFLNDMNVYSDWGEKMHFYKTNNDFNYRKNELPLDVVYNFYDNNMIKESLEPEEVDLSSFEIKDKLNPKFWKNNKIDSRIRLKLLDIADDFVDSLEVKWVEPEDIIMTGSLANFTWNEEYSDIDLHIVMDFKKVDKRTDFVQNYFKSKKKEWEDKHENLKIYGFPIEVYVQDKNEKHTASGIYSLEKNEWILEPSKDNFNENDYEDEVVKNKVSEYTKKIDKLLEDFEEKTTESDIETIYNKSISLFNKIKDERNDELHAKDAKELSNGNLIFKSLRRNGYIEKLINLRNNSYDKCNSLN